ncbi:MAG: hypothetical protein KAH21_01720, partial [Spirochaetaceae bacterium]|nr:hypothetical protein [Spirochaetaceae bacterium]
APAQNQPVQDQAPSGPPVHIHLPPQSSLPPAPQVVYQDIRPVSQPSQPAPPPPMEMPEVSVEEITEEEIPSFPEPEIEPVLEEEQEELILDESELEISEEDEPFFIPESDALSEDLPENSEPVIPEADLVFSDQVTLEEVDEELALVEDFDIPEESTDDSTEESPDESLGSEKVAEMFKYLSNLTDETTGEGRQHLIDEGVPLKMAGIHARLTGEPNFREVAQKYDRRSRERHQVELNEETIKESLNAFKSLADAYPNHSVGESLSKKLGKIMSYVSRKKDS